MRQLFLLGATLLSVWACTPPPTASVQSSPTTSTFDGTYANAVVSAQSGTCPTLGPLPSLTIHNGMALLQGPNLAFSGYVTPQGALGMNSTTGQQVFKGQIDPQFVLRARVQGPNCAYDVTWNRVS